MKRLSAMALVLAAAGCAAGNGGGAQAGAGTGSAREPPVVMYRVLDPYAPHPTIRVPYDTARELGVTEAAFATPAMIDRLEASCADSSQPVQCRRELRTCREKTCRVVSIY